MATVIGRNATLEESADNITYLPVAKGTSISMTVSDDIADETNNDSGGFKEGQYADSQANIDATAKYNNADAGQNNVIAAKIAKTAHWLRFRPEGALVGGRQFVAQYLLPDVTIDTETGAVEDLSITAESTGILTVSAVP